MKRLLVSIVAIAALASLAITGCSQAAPAAPAAPAKSAPAQAAPAQKLDFPGDRNISLIVPHPAGQSVVDTFMRLTKDAIQTEMGTTVELVNKSGAGTQIGLTELANSKPDGYTLVIGILPNFETIMENPNRKATFTRKDFIPLGMDHVDPGAVAVAANGPYKSLKDVIDQAKANPAKVRAAGTGLLGDDHLAALDVERAAGVKFALVQFEGSGDREAAMLGGKVDISFGNAASFWTSVKGGNLRLVGIMDRKPWGFDTSIPTLESMGINSYAASARGFYAPAGTPQPVVDYLVAAFKRAITGHPDRHEKMKNLGYIVEYMDPAQVNAYWDEVHNTIAPLMKQAITEQR